MGLKKPFKRTCRQFVDGSYANSGKSMYILHDDFANSPANYIRAFLLIQKDLQSLFEYIEPSDANLGCYSYRIHELLLRICVEVEANCKAILEENGYAKKGDLNMGDYKKIEFSHRVSKYEVRLPIWHGSKNLWKPFEKWSSGASLLWYKAYHATKHNRSNEFSQASFENLINAVCGLVVILSAQFWTKNFMKEPSFLALESDVNDEMEPAIGGFFQIKFPNDWPEAERYDFTHNDIRDTGFGVATFDYKKV